MKYKTTIILIIIIIIFSVFVKIPEYVELNHLIIVEKIGVECDKEDITLYLKEVIPIKDDNGINYKYKIYKGSDKSISKAYNKINNKTNNKIFYSDTKSIISNCPNDNKIKKFFNIKNINIKHKSNVYEQIKKS